MTYRFDALYIGYPPIESALNDPGIAKNPMIPAFITTADDPVWGAGEFVYGRAAAAIRQYGLCAMLPAYDAVAISYITQQNFIEAPNVANSGRPCYVCQAAGGLALGQYGWFMRTGISPVNSNASVALDTVYGLAAAGQAGALTSGKQVLSSRIVTPATQTVAWNALPSIVGDTRINFRRTDGFIVGGYVSGTGIPAGATITAIDPLGRFILISAATTADPSGAAITCTYNNGVVFYNVAHMDCPTLQGAIT